MTRVRAVFEGVAFGRTERRSRPDTTSTSTAAAAVWGVDVNFESQPRSRIANRNFTRAEWREYFPEMPYQVTLPDLPASPELTPK